MCSSNTCLPALEKDFLMQLNAHDESIFHITHGKVISQRLIKLGAASCEWLGRNHPVLPCHSIWEMKGDGLIIERGLWTSLIWLFG